MAALLKMLNEGVNDLVRDQRLARSIRCGLIPIHGEHAAQLVVSISHCAHCFG
jgi:hypothetical protein